MGYTLFVYRQMAVARLPGTVCRGGRPGSRLGIHLSLGLGLALGVILGSVTWAMAAAPRSVAVVNIAGNQEAGAALAGTLRAAMNSEESLRLLDDGELARALEDAMASSVTAAERMDTARDRLRSARDQLDLLQYNRVFAELAEAEQELLAVEPAPEVSLLLAEVAFLRGSVSWREGDSDRARLELALMHRLHRDRPGLDPARHPPGLVRLFEDARAPAQATATLRVTTPFYGTQVFLDGKPSGTTPAEVALPPGVYYVAGKIADHDVIGQRVEVSDAANPTVVKLRFTRVTVDERARYMRRKLFERGPIVSLRGTIPDTANHRAASAMVDRAAFLASAEIVVLIGDDPLGQLWVTSFDLRQGTSSGWHAAGRLSMKELLMQLQLIPWPPVDLSPPTGISDSGGGSGNGTRDDPNWWVRFWTPNRVKAGVAFGVIASVVGFSLYQLRPQTGPETVSGSCCTVVNEP